MPSNGYKRSKLRSPCCSARVNVCSFTRTFTDNSDPFVRPLPVGRCLIGECAKCGKTVMRINPTTRRQEWLPDGTDPLTDQTLELVSP